MFCPRCGAENANDAYRCSSCGAEIANPPMGLPMVEVPQIFNWLVPAIIVNLCCCPPLGLVSVIYAAQVNSKVEAGNIDGAIQAARNARMWFWIGILVGIPIQLTLGFIQYFAVMEQLKNLPSGTF